MRPRLFAFGVCFPLCLAVFGFAQHLLDQRRDKLLGQQAAVILRGVADQFTGHIRAVTAGQLGMSELLESRTLSDAEYTSVAQKIRATLPEVVGVNLLDAEGRIVRIWPPDYNSRALGKTSQNIAELRASRARGDLRWLSPPFRLFQGDQGFVVYEALNQRGSAAGWLAVVVTSESFFREFTKGEYGRNFEISATDERTGAPYFQARQAPTTSGGLVQSVLTGEFGRQIRITIWPKEHLLYPWYVRAWPLLLALLFSGVLAFAFSWWQERRQAQAQLEELNNLLRLTIHDASGTLATIKGYLEIMHEDPHLVPVERLSKHVGIVADLLDQIKLVRRFSGSAESWRREPVSLLNLVLDVSDVIGDRLKNKDLFLRYDPEKLSGAQLNLNKGLFGHSVLGNLLTHAIRTSHPGSVVSIDYHRRPSAHEIRIVSQAQIAHKAPVLKENLGLQIATEVLRLHHGSLEVSTDAAGTMTTKVLLAEAPLH